jgi:hypothetical protein
MAARRVYESATELVAGTQAAAKGGRVMAHGGFLSAWARARDQRVQSASHERMSFSVTIYRFFIRNI